MTHKLVRFSSKVLTKRFGKLDLQRANKQVKEKCTTMTHDSIGTSVIVTSVSILSCILK